VENSTKGVLEEVQLVAYEHVTKAATVAQEEQTSIRQREAGGIFLNGTRPRSAWYCEKMDMREAVQSKHDEYRGGGDIEYYFIPSFLTSILATRDFSSKIFYYR
jgi:hypothetical protein